MPTYEYECKNCSHELEIFQSMKDEPLKQCPKCKKNTLRRKLGTGAGIIFKGEGFYATDYRSEDYKKKAKSETKETSTTSENKKDNKKESKSSESKS